MLAGRTYAPRTIAAACALLVTGPVAIGGAASTRAAPLQTKLVGVWHKKMTKAEWDRARVSRAVGVYTIVINKAGKVIVYRPGDRPGCSFCAPDFETTMTTNGAQLMLGAVPVCSFKGAY